MSLRVTVEDTEEGTKETVVVSDYLLIVAHPCHLARRVAHPNGTHILTVKQAARPGYSISQTFEFPATSPEPGPAPIAEAPTLTEIVNFLDPDGVWREPLHAQAEVVGEAGSEATPNDLPGHSTEDGAPR